MKKFYFLTLFAFISLFANAQSYQWAKGIGGTGYEYCNHAVIDGSGNLYMTGSFTSTADFNPGTGTANLTSVGQEDIFIAKYDANGNYLWAKRIGSTNPDMGYGIAVDGAGNCYVTGTFELTVDFDPGAGTANLTSGGQEDIFIAKYDANGNYIWAKSMGSSGQDYGNCIILDGTGNCYLTGYFQGTVDFDPGVGTANLISNSGSNDIFFAKYDASGNYIWAKSIGSNNPDNGYGIAVDGTGNLYITGSFSSTADFDPGAGTANLTSNSSACDIFFAKYDASGNYIWAKNIGGTSGVNYGRCIVVDGTGNCYITGSYSWTADFDPGAGTVNLTSNQGSNIFFAKYDSNGNYIWAKGIGADLCDDSGNSIAIDGTGNCYITGYFRSTVDFDPGAGTANLTVNGGSVYSDIFFAKYDANGNYIWAKGMGGSSDDSGNSIAIDGTGYCYVAGCFKNTVDFDPGTGVANHTSAGNTDVFLAKYTQSSAGIIENNQQALINIYPNPATNNLTIESDVKTSIEILNIQGQLIKTIAANGNKTNVDISALAKGMYFVKVKTENGVAVKKFLKE